MPSSREHRLRYYKYRRSELNKLGLCIDCANKAVVSETRCEKCKQRNKEYKQKRRDNHADNGT